jgi:hypothetical protein
MRRDSYRDLQVPDDLGQPLREELARLVYGFDAVTDADRTRLDYLAVADHIIEFVVRRAVQGDGRGSPKSGRGTVRALRIAMWVLVVIAVPVLVYVLWLLQVGL